MRGESQIKREPQVQQQDLSQSRQWPAESTGEGESVRVVCGRARVMDARAR